ncbi:MAG: adenylate/guanylate cyclase domain-containing protein [Proteobacteria bacterium]|nr:adenylate/guanylate cyclase domain-containing protein [Pseudomonadota bacterium]
MAENAESAEMVEAAWREFLTIGKVDQEQRQRRILSKLPGQPRCRLCHAPFKGLGSPVARLVFSRRPSSLHPRLCNTCGTFAKRFMGGAEIELTTLFADVRGSTGLAEKQRPTEFADLMNRFYKASTDVLIKSNAFIDKLVGDEVVALFVPVFAGPSYCRAAIDAAEKLLRATGHDAPDACWIPLGVGVHTGTAFMGAVGAKDQKIEITALGDAMNVGARLASEAKQREAFISEATVEAAGMDLSHLERRELKLKGRSEPVAVRVLRVDSTPAGEKRT